MQPCFQIKRRQSRRIMVGNVPIGGGAPVAVQSMTNTETTDIAATVAQINALEAVGADIVRVSVPTMEAADAFGKIRQQVNLPLISDIHFDYKIALRVAELGVDCLRINPGNIGREDRVRAVVDAARDKNIPIRIGVNAGSLEKELQKKYGEPTHDALVESAMRHIDILDRLDFQDFKISLKASDVFMTVLAYRQLATQIEQPLHLGITEAGEGDDGRIISAAGSGTLLAEGIGDTLRVSLSEAPEKEIPVAREIIHAVAGSAGRVRNPVSPLPFRQAGERYFPQVYTEEEDDFRDEQGKVFEGKVITLRPEELTVLADADRIHNAVLNPVFREDDAGKLVIDAAALLGRFFIARQPAGICITNTGSVSEDALRRLAFGVLQATEARITRTRYISCPTCGRTKFNLEEAVRKVKAATSHLGGMKIAVMGCIVNGPGEMAGADYGYVGAAEGRVHIYRGTEAVMKNVPEEEALSRLLELIEKDQARR